MSEYFSCRLGVMLLMLVFMMLLVSVHLAAATSSSVIEQKAEQAYRLVKKNYRQFNHDKKQWPKRKNWIRLIKRFTSINQSYPHSRRADDALFLAASLYSSLYNYSGWDADLQRANDLYGKVVSAYRESRLADDSLYHMGLNAGKLGHQDQSRAYFRQVIQDFPQGDMVSKAKARLILSPPAAKASPASCVTSGTGVYHSEAPRRKGNLKGKARVDNIRYWSSPTYTRVVVDLDQEVSYSRGILRYEKQRDRIKTVYLDLHNAFITGSSRAIDINDGILKKVKLAQFNKQTVRTAIYLDSIDDYKIFDLSNPPRIVIDVIGNRAKERVPRHHEGVIKRGKGVGASGDLSLAQQLGLGIGKIVIDPGHGGKDPGAVGPHRVMEKDVVLDIALKLKKELKKQMNFQVVMTRDHDCFIPLEERTVIANTKKADLFVSIHANASRNRKAHGVETYFLNLATDKEAMELAALENATSTKKISDLQLILSDLMRNSKISESSRLARAVQDSLVKRLKSKYSQVKNLGVKQAPFYVLIGAQMPSILIETSFVSHRMEEKRLNTAAYRQKIAEGIAAGIKKYIEQVKTARLHR
ncbi:MAG: N-acetylmuramoyl-L-alanine amidase [Pseudomonadota bacterium]|nr:N-acetylmuramoyl-L-alanine amidase [Pseudomonadota bacterium]